MTSDLKELSLFIIYSGISTTLFLTVLVFKHWKKTVTHPLLIGLLLGLLILFLTYTTVYFEWHSYGAGITPIGLVMPFALGPLCLQYIKTQYTQKMQWPPFLRSLIPFGMALLLVSVPMYLLRISEGNHEGAILFFFGAALSIGVIHLGVYLYQSHRLLKRFVQLVKGQYATLNRKDLRWLSLWVKGLAVFLLIDIFSGMLIVYFPMLTFLNLFYLVVLIWYLGYFGLQQGHILLQTAPVLVEAPKQHPESKEAPAKTTALFDCNSELFQQTKTALETLFVDQELFKQQDLSLKDTAEMLGISDKKLSYLLNEGLNSSFYDYVNGHRIRYFKALVEEGSAQNLTLLALAFDSGFNSKATFNRVFKQLEGRTPSAFKKEVLKRSQSIQ